MSTAIIKLQIEGLRDQVVKAIDAKIIDSAIDLKALMDANITDKMIHDAVQVTVRNLINKVLDARIEYYVEANMTNIINEFVDKRSIEIKIK